MKTRNTKIDALTLSIDAPGRREGQARAIRGPSGGRPLSVVRFGLSLGVVGVLALVSACSGGPEEAPPFDTQPLGLEAKLEGLTGARWRADRNEAGTALLYFSAGEGKAVLPDIGRTPSDALALLAPFAAELGLGSDLSREFGAGECLTPATDDAVGIYRFAQHLPGTEIPVFGGQLVVAVTKEGVLEYVSTTHARGLDRIKERGALSATEVTRLALAELGAGYEASGAVLGVNAKDHDHPRLAYRMTLSKDGIALQVDVDADTGTILETQSKMAGAKALSAAHYLDDSDLRYERNASRTVYLTPAHKMEVSGPSGPIRIQRPDGTAAECTGDPSSSQPMECDTNVAPGGAKGVAVDAQGNLLAAARYFQTQLGYTRWADPIVRASVNMVKVGTRPVLGDGFFLVGGQGLLYPQDQLFFGAGLTYEQANPIAYAGNHAYALYPTGMSLEFVAHEYAHGVTRSVTPLNFEDEAGALNEALSDIFAAHAEALARGSSESLYAFATDTRGDGRPLRHFMHPGRGTDLGGTSHYSKRRPTTPRRDGNSNCFGVVANPDAAPNDCGNIHYNSTIVSNAWALLATGGFNEVSGVGVVAEVGLSKAVRLFWETLFGTASAETMSTYAHRMVALQVKKWVAHPYATDLEPMWVKKAVVCAWNAVGVIPDNEIAWHGFGWTCPKASQVTRTCKGKADGDYCNPDLQFTYDSYRCKGGAISAGSQCPTGTFCHRTSASPDSPAEKEGGKVKCFAEPQDW